MMTSAPIPSVRSLTKRFASPEAALIVSSGGSKARAAVALMRKLVKALFHVARGAPMNTQKLFDTTRLNIAPALSEG